MRYLLCAAIGVLCAIYIKNRKSSLIWTVLLCLLALLVTACQPSQASPPLTEGIALRLIYDDEDRWTTQGACLHRNLKTNFCYAYATDHHHDPPHWYVKVYDTINDRVVTVEVSQGTHAGCRPAATWRNDRCLG